VTNVIERDRFGAGGLKRSEIARARGKRGFGLISTSLTSLDHDLISRGDVLNRARGYLKNYFWPETRPVATNIYRDVNVRDGGAWR